MLQVPNGQGCAWNVLEHGSVIHIRLIILEELAAMNPAAYPPKDENATSPTSQGNAGSSGRQDRHDTFFHRLSVICFCPVMLNYLVASNLEIVAWRPQTQSPAISTWHNHHQPTSLFPRGAGAASGTASASGIRVDGHRVGEG